MNDITYFKSTKGKKKVAHKGYIYQLDKEKGQTGYWKCENREDCRVRLTLTYVIVTKEKSHSHAPDTAAGKICLLWKNLLKMAGNAHQPY